MADDLNLKVSSQSSNKGSVRFSKALEQLKELDKLSADTASRKTDLANWNKEKHDNEARLSITKLVLWWYFGLIIFSFLYAAGYNSLAIFLNQHLTTAESIKLLDVSNTVSLITSTLGSGVGFVIGYYFKNKGE